MRSISQTTPVALLLFALLACLLIPTPSVAHETTLPEQPEWVLPPVQWTKDLDSGYVSTKPLIFEDVVVVKVGGKSDSPGGPWDEGKAPGLYAFHLQNGTLAWRYEHQQSTTGFEISPILNVREHQMVVNGWTSGHVTAHDLQSGELLWTAETSVQAWGVTGGLQYIGEFGDAEFEPTIHVSGEKSFYGLSPYNGSILFENQIPDGKTGYRNGVSVIALSTDAGFPNWDLMAGDESGLLHAWGLNGSNYTSWDVPAIAALEGEWKIRAPPLRVFPLDDAFTTGVGVVLQGNDGGKFVVLRIDTNGSASVSNSFDLGIAPALPVFPGLFFLVTGDLDRVQVRCLWNHSICDEVLTIDSGPVTGEITSAWPGSGVGITVPHNTADGYWTGHLVDLNQLNWSHSLEWDWHPQKAGWLTAGVAVTPDAMAAANDASWLEVRFFSDMLPDGSTPAISDGPITRATATGLSMNLELMITITLFFSTAGLALGSRKSLTAGSLGLLLVALILLPVLNTAWVTSVADQAPDHEVDRSGFPDEWANSQIVCFEFPEDVWQAEGGEVGETRLLDESGVELESVQDDQTRTCVGGFEGHGTVGSLTHAGAGVAGFEVGYEQQPLGNFIEDIGPGIGGDDDRWWLYWVDGKHGNLAVDAQPLSESSIIEWRFL